MFIQFGCKLCVVVVMGEVCEGAVPYIPMSCA